MKTEILKLRKELPIPLAEAKQLLEENEGDVEKCVYLYKAKAIKQIMDITGCTKQTADKHYTAEKMDINRAISAIKEEIYDKNYRPIKGVDKDSLYYIKDWLLILKGEDFGVSLGYKYLQEVVDVFSRIPKLKDIAETLADAKQVYDKIFEGYHDGMAMDEFIRRNCLLDGSPAFQKANREVPLQIEMIKDEIRRHWRNVQ